MATFIGLNIGGDQSATANLPYQAAENAADLAFLKTYTGNLRAALVYYPDTNDTNNIKQLVIDAKNAGYHVMSGITAGAEADISASYTGWLNSGIVAYAQWAQAHNVDEFQIGNEEDWNCFINGAFTAKTPTQIRNDVKSKVAAVRAVYSGVISYATAEGMLDDWISEGIGGLDKIYFNVYDTLTNFNLIVNKIVTNFGAKGGISEWSAQHPFPFLGMTEAQYATEIANRNQIIFNSGISSAYLFTWKIGGGDDWGFSDQSGHLHQPAFSNAFVDSAHGEGGTLNPRPVIVSTRPTATARDAVMSREPLLIPRTRV